MEGDSILKLKVLRFEILTVVTGTIIWNVPLCSLAGVFGCVLLACLLHLQFDPVDENITFIQNANHNVTVT